MTDQETAKKVFDSLFVKQRAAQTKEEVEQRLFVAHTLINSVLMNNTATGEVIEKWEEELSDIEEHLNELRTKIAQAKT
ncbi:hypothetical protein [Pedosphaera parvula]|uniref:Uncharacterized protein n=1 Tax=Pedosphaera parvula (strain Ellin514) TaxID=320771 RepID=B9XR18_PEDPL|nr:hypothetical protein [Pedosphaera parvula]EEF57714.1 hypothetical protein Cflav_PD0776 [Pedosphaera parvula Ellin514]